MPGFAVTLALAVLAASPLVGLAPGDVAPARYAVGFYELPSGLHVGEVFHGGLVVSINERLGSVSVIALAPRDFEARGHADERVRYVEAMPSESRIQFVPDDSNYAGQYAPKQVGADFAWDVTLGSTSVVVCVADTGIRYTHEDLVDRYAGGHDYVNNDTDPWDDHGHGTHVSGIVAATTDNGVGIAGIAKVTLKHAKVLDATGFGPWDVIAAGIVGCVDDGAHIVSLSLGGTTGATILEDAVNYAWDQGVLVVASAGNSGPCTNCVSYPAKYASAIAVGCTTGWRTVCAFASSGPEVDLVAPGDNILSTWHTSDAAYRYQGGTSMSAPHVAGVAALVKSVHPTFTNAQIRSTLETQAEDVDAPGVDNASGQGLVRADRVLGAPQVYSGRLVAGTGAGLNCEFDTCALVEFLGYDDLSRTQFPILPAPGSTYALTTTSVDGMADANVCWRDVNDEQVGPCSMVPFVQDASIVPEGAVRADVSLRVGVDATYALTIDA